MNTISQVATIGRAAGPNVFCYILLFGTSAYAAPAPARVALVPAPVSVNWLDGSVELGANTKIYYATEAARIEANTLAEFLRPATGFTFPVAALPNSLDKSSSAIVLKLRPDLKTSVGAEGYVLEVSPGGTISIAAGEPAGLFYGGQTVRQLLPPPIYAARVQPALKCSLPCCRIVDSPRFAWRGYLLDFSRHFLDMAYAKHLLDGMAMHKLNVLHMHLADDDGWRIEIKKYPKLTEVGAWRGTKCDLPNTRPGENFERYGGFFTQDQIRELVAYAARLHINLMPEIDLPGHSLALCIAHPQTRPTRLLNGKIVPGTTGNVISPAKESNYAMIDDIFGELSALFPYDYIHIGGDEVDHNQWSECPEIKAFLVREKIADLHMAQVYFTKRMEGILAKHHKRMIGWNEILNDKLQRSTGIMSWTGVGPGYEGARMGFPVVMAPAQHNYFDLQYPDANDEPPALDWAGKIDCKQCYKFDPLGEKGLSVAEGRRILGVHGCLWSELVVPFKSSAGWLDLKTPGETADYKTYPRLCALSEMGWTPQAARDYASFAERLGYHYERLKEAAIMFRVPPVEAIAHGKTIDIHPPFHGIDIRYTLDGSDPLQSAQALAWDGKPVSGNPDLFRARSFVQGRPSALSVAEPPVKAKAK